jgi:Arc/MetJ-type ribon-helix-helix transcriptional regulator
MLVMTIITVRIDDETRRMMREVKVNWSDFIRNAIRRKVEEERRRNLARAVLINERLRRASRGEAKAEEIIRKFRDERYAEASC